MSIGSLKHLTQVLTNTLASKNCYPIPEELSNAIDSYLDKHTAIEEHDSQRLHDELMHLYSSKISQQPDKHAAFLAAFRQLRPALVGAERLIAWWDILVRPTLDSLGQSKAVVGDARSIVLSVLVYDEDDDKNGDKARTAAIFTERLFEVFLEKTKVTSSERAGFAEEEKQRFVVNNVEAVLLAYGKRKPKAFMEHIDTYVIQKEYRLQVLGLLCSFVRLQGPHLYQVLQTPLFEHLLQCLQIDTSTTVLSLALTVLTMFMPHICNSLAKYLPQLFFIYTRFLCWDKYGVVRIEDIKFPMPGGKETHRADSPASLKEDSAGNVWAKLESSFETATSTTPDVTEFFTFLYGLYPINLVAYIREPYKFLERADYKDVDDLDIDEESVRMRTEKYRQRHVLHPNFFTLTQETELTDQTRWMKVEPSGVTALCIGLVNRDINSDYEKTMDLESLKPLIPDALLPTEDIPIESLLNSDMDEIPVDEEFAGLYGHDNSSYSWKDGSRKVTGSTPHRSRVPSPTTKAQDMRGQDSPTLPAQVDRPSLEYTRVQNMLQLQENLRSNLHSQHKNESTTSLANNSNSNGYGSVTASPRLDAYVHSLQANTIPRSPAIRPAPSDTQATVAYLQREVMLLRNDLNFERYLKQQHLSHIGHLQRKHIKESTAEAETQNLLYTNKALKSKLEEAKKAYNRSKAEALQQKTQSKKWEAELNFKVRALREEQKVWKAEEEAVKRALDTARKDVEHLRRMVAESEAKELLSQQKLQSLGANLEELDRLKEMNEQLRIKLQEYEGRQEEFEMAKHAEESAVAQVERIKLRLHSQQAEKDNMRRAYEIKIADLESRINHTEAAPRSQSPTPGGGNFQSMIDSAVQSVNNKLALMKRAHQILLTKYTELEIKHIELNAQFEMAQMTLEKEKGASPAHTRDSTFSSNNGDEQYRRPSYATTNIHHPYATSELTSPTESLSPNATHDMHVSQQFQNTYFQSETNSPISPMQSMSSPMYGREGNYGSLMSPNPPPMTPLPPTPVEMANYMQQQQQQQHQQHQQHQQQQQQQYQQQQQQYQQHHQGDYGQGMRSMQSMPTMQDQSRPQLRTMPSMPESNEDSRSVKTIGNSSQSSQERKQKEKVKPTSEVRVRGRGGVQNISKKEKKDDEPKEKKERRGLRFPTGSALAGIRGFH